MIEGQDCKGRFAPVSGAKLPGFEWIQRSPLIRTGVRAGSLKRHSMAAVENPHKNGRIYRRKKGAPASAPDRWMENRSGLEPVQSLYAAALECNRDEFEGMVRSLHRGASKGQRAEIARFHSNP